jgi:hypothetical protein
VFSGWVHLVDPDKPKPKRAVLNDDKLFSLSSVTSPASRKVTQREEQKKKEAAAADTKESLPGTEQADGS